MRDKTFRNKNNTAGKYLFLAVLIIVIDQITKYYAQQSSFVKNTGIIFGLAQNSNQIMIYVSIVAVAILLATILFGTARHKLLCAFILGGVIGNLTDRLFKGYVIDFIDVGFFPVFNVADAAISVSVVLLLLFSFISDKREKRLLSKMSNEFRRHR